MRRKKKGSRWGLQREAKKQAVTQEGQDVHIDTGLLAKWRRLDIQKAWASAMETFSKEVSVELTVSSSVVSCGFAFLTVYLGLGIKLGNMVGLWL